MIMTSFVVAEIILQYCLIVREPANLKPFLLLGDFGGWWNFYDKQYREVHSSWD